MAIKKIIVKNIEYDINYEILNLQNSDSILFLHGWGSNKEVMKSAFKEHLQTFKHIYIDMPGFGKSYTEQVLTTDEYKNIILSFLCKIGEKPYVIFGHSFGGKVATLINPKILVLLSTAGILEKKSLIIRAKIALFKILKPFGGKKLISIFATKDVKGMNENMYQTLKNVVNEDFTKIFGSFKNSAYIFWGEEDSATSLTSGKKISSLIKNSKFYSFTGNHYFFLEYSNEISKILEKDLTTHSF